MEIQGWREWPFSSLLADFYAKSKPWLILVTDIALSILIQMPLLYLHPPLCLLGFCVGVRFDKKGRALADTINGIMQTNLSRLEKRVLFAGGTVLALLNVPSCTIIAAFCCSAQLGAWLYQDSLTRLRRMQNSG